MRRVFLARGVAVAVLALAGIGYYVFMQSDNPFTQPPVALSSVVHVGGVDVAVGVAKTEAERVQGLSGRPPLDAGTGLLFDFEVPGTYGIWMKDMRFSIDIIWANEGRVVTVAHKVSPETYPKAFMPTAPARYVLEVPAGFAAAHGIAEGANFVVQ